MYYIMDFEGNPMEVPAWVWAGWFTKANRLIARTQLGAIEVSTIFLPWAHGAVDGWPILYETALFVHDQAGDRHLVKNSIRRYTDKELAIAEHRAIVEVLTNIEAGPAPGRCLGCAGPLPDGATGYCLGCIESVTAARFECATCDGSGVWADGRACEDCTKGYITLQEGEG